MLEAQQLLESKVKDLPHIEWTNPPTTWLERTGGYAKSMDLRDYFRSSDADTAVKRARLYRTNGTWQWRRLLNYPKPTIAMVNGWCFEIGRAHV